MIKKSDTSERAMALRQRAEEMVRDKDTSKGTERSLEATQALIHDLHVHQIELEMQNDELRRIHAELDAARERYFDLYDLAPVGYCTISLEGRILESNLTAVTLLGTSRDELLQRPITGFILKEDQDVYYLHHRQLQENAESSGCDLRMVTKGGRVFWANLMATIVRSPAHLGEPSAAEPVIRLTLSDITERVLAEEEKALLEAQLQQAQKLETLGVLAGGVAHDFNNLLAAILGYANLGSMAVDPKGVAAPFLVAIEKAAMRAADLTHQLLAYAGKGKYVVSEVDLDVVIKEVLQILSVSIPPRVTLQRDFSDRLPFVKGDATQILQILMNLVSNAAEAIPEGAEGLITVRTRAEVIDETIEKSDSWILPLMPGSYSTLEVTDTGAGMTPEVLARIFEPFYTTKFTGRGLGLSAVMGILGSHGGGLRVETEPGHGSSFKIFLPAMQGRRSFAAADTASVWRGEGRILLVDDDQAVRSMARRMAEHLGFTVVEAQSGQEAIDIFRLQHTELALIILDLGMPRMNGVEAFKKMWEIDKTVPVLLSSGYNVLDTSIAIDGLAGFLKKPYRIAEFQALLQRILTPVDTESQ